MSEDEVSSGSKYEDNIESTPEESDSTDDMIEEVGEDEESGGESEGGKVGNSIIGEKEIHEACFQFNNDNYFLLMLWPD